MQYQNTRHDAYWAARPQDDLIDECSPDANDDADAIDRISDAAALSYDAYAKLVDRLQRSELHNAALKRELGSAHARLNVVLELSEKAATFDNQPDLESDLFKRYAHALAASAILIDDGAVCRRVNVETAHPIKLDLTAFETRALLIESIAETRRTRRTILIGREQAGRMGWHNGCLMLSPLQQDASEPHVIIAARDKNAAEFAENDRLASEMLLVYGGHILHNALMVRHLKQASFETVGALANAIEARDKYTGGHSERVGWLAAMTGQALELTSDQIQMLEWAGWLHDVGKIGIPENILNKPGELTPDEYDHIKQHPILGYEVLSPVSSLKPVLQAVLYHHENWDGTGYPEGLKGEDAPLLARILHVVDIFDALTSTRSYRRRLDVEQALEMLAKNAGATTDPVVTEAFINAFRAYQNSDPRGAAAQFAHI